MLEKVVAETAIPAWTAPGFTVRALCCTTSGAHAFVAMNSASAEILRKSIIPTSVNEHPTKRFVAIERRYRSHMSPKAKPGAADTLIDASLAEQTRKVLQTLTPREEAVLRQRFGIDTPSGEAPPEEVGQDFEVTKARIAEIERKALEKLRSPRRSERLEAFVDDDGEDD